MNSGNDESCSGAVEKCRQGFDESGLFQVSELICFSLRTIFTYLRSIKRKGCVLILIF